MSDFPLEIRASPGKKLVIGEYGRMRKVLVCPKNDEGRHPLPALANY